MKPAPINPTRSWPMESEPFIVVTFFHADGRA